LPRKHDSLFALVAFPSWSLAWRSRSTLFCTRYLTYAASYHCYHRTIILLLLHEQLAQLSWPALHGAFCNQLDTTPFPSLQAFSNHSTSTRLYNTLRYSSSSPIDRSIWFQIPEEVKHRCPIAADLASLFSGILWAGFHWPAASMGRNESRAAEEKAWLYDSGLVVVLDALSIKKKNSHHIEYLDTCINY